MQSDKNFWEIYDKAAAIAAKHPDWDYLEMQREFVFDQTRIPDEFREEIENSMDRQYIMIMWEMWKHWSS